MRILLIESACSPREADISITLTFMQALVGSTTQAVYPFEVPVKPVLLSRRPFGIDQKREAILKRQILELRIFKLGRKLFYHQSHVNLMKL